MSQGRVCNEIRAHPTLSHPRPELTQPQSRAWPRAVYGRPGAIGSGPRPGLQGRISRGLSDTTCQFRQAPCGWSSDSGSFESPWVLSHTRRVTEPRPGRVCAPHWADRPWLHELKCRHGPAHCLAPGPPRSAPLKGKLRHALPLRTGNSFRVAGRSPLAHSLSAAALTAVLEEDAERGLRRPRRQRPPQVPVTRGSRR